MADGTSLKMRPTSFPPPKWSRGTGEVEALLHDVASRVSVYWIGELSLKTEREKNREKYFPMRSMLSRPRVA